MAIFFKNILRSIKSNWLSVFSLVFFITIISTVFSAASNLTGNLRRSIDALNQSSHVHDAVIDENYDYGDGKFTSNNTNLQTNRVLSAISSTQIPIVKPASNGSLQTSGGSVLITAHNITPPFCTELGAAFQTQSGIFNFVNPNEIQFDVNGNLISNSFLVTWQCGTGGQLSLPVVLDSSSPRGFLRDGYNYINNIFKSANLSANENKVNSSGFQDAYAIKVRGDGDTGTEPNNFTWFGLIKQKVSSVQNTLSPEKNNNTIAWTKSYKHFYDYVESNPNLNVANPYNLTTENLNQAKNMLKPMTAYLDLRNVSTQELTIIFLSLITTHLKDGNAITADLQKAYAEKFSDVFLKLVYLYWTKHKDSISFEQLVSLDKMSDKMITDFKSYIGTILAGNNSEFKSLNTDQKYIFSSTSNDQSQKFSNLWNSLTNYDKQSLFVISKNALNSQLITTTNNLSSDQMGNINKFVLDHQMWNVDDALNDFVFMNSVIKQEERYNLIRNNMKSIIVNSSGQSGSGADAATTYQSYKIIQTNDQTNNQQFVNKLVVYQGNNLFYNQSFNDYQILQNWLKIRSQRKNLNQAEEIPFVRMLLRSKFSSPSIRDVFTKYLRILTGVPNSFLSGTDTDSIRDYEQQIQNGNWSFNGYYLEFSLTEINFVFPLSTLGSESQKITQVPSPAYITRRNASFAVVSPTYAKRHGIEPISQEEYKKFEVSINDQNIDQAEWELILQGFTSDPRYQKNIIDVNGTKVIVVGIGLTADFAFPSLSLFNLIPNVDNQGLLYVSPSGYNFLLADNPAAAQENYIAVQYPQAIVKQNLTEPFYEQLSKKINDYGAGKIFYRANDTSMIFSATAYRFSFVNSIISILNLVGYLLIGIVAVITLFGVVVLVRRYAKNNSMVFGNLGANGVSKLMIILSTTVFILIPSILGPIIGYFVGLYTQSNLYDILSNYWFLNSSPEQFSFLTIIYYVLVPIAVLSLVAIIAAAITLKASSLVLMRENPIFKQTRFSLALNNLFNKFSPLWKFRLIVAANSMPRIMLLSGMSSLMLVVLVFVFANIGQFNKVSTSETSAKRYGYAIQYQTPSAITGPTPMQSYGQLGQTYLNKIAQTQNILYQKNNSSWDSAPIDFNAENPLLVSSNIENYFQNAANSSYANSYKTALEQNPTQAITDLNKNLHINPGMVNYWGQSSVLTQYMLRSVWNSSENRYESFGLPKPDDKQPKEKLFYYSTQDYFNSDRLLSSIKPTNYNTMVEQSKLFAPYGLANTDKASSVAWMKQKADTTHDNGSSRIYYADYVPFVDENRDATNGSKLVLAPDGTPLFKPLSDLYRTKKPLLPFNNSAGDYQSYTSSPSNEYSVGTNNNQSNNDYYTWKEGENADFKLPLLNRLYRDNANYWIISIDDRNGLKINPNFLKNRVLTKLLLDHTIEINDFGSNLKINTWNILSSVINRSSPGILNEMNSNYTKLIRRIIESRYGPYFVNRFMTMQPITQPLVNFEGKIKDGDEFSGQSSYLISDKDIYSTVSGQRTINSSTDPSSDARLIPGVYYLDSKKTLYLYVKFIGKDATAPYNVFALYRPDFLYFVYALFNDPNFNTPETGSTKLAFNANAVAADYSNPAKQWETTGDLEQDANQAVGLTATDPAMTLTDYAKVPNGDQTYSYLNGQFANQSDNSLIYGIKQDRRGSYFQLYNDGTLINDRLYTPVQDKIIPMIINQYAARKFNFKVNDVVRYKVINDAMANQNALNQQITNADEQVKFRIVGISDSYYNAFFFISQKNANEVLKINGEYGYNGVFTRKPSDGTQLLQMSNALTVYASSDVYAQNQFDQNSASGRELFSQNAVSLGNNISIPSNMDYLRLRYNLSPNTNTPALALSQFNQVYGSNPLLPLINTLDDSSVSNELFTKLSSTMQALVIIVLIVFIPLLVIMVLMVTSLVIDDLRQLSVVMIMLGFNNWENSMTVLTYLLPVFLISLAVGMPVAAVFLNAYIGVIFSSVSLLLPIQMLPWYFLSSIGILLSIFGSALFQSYWKLKQIFLPIAMKALGD